MIYCHVVEPSLGLAPTIVDRIFEMILRLRETGLTILLKETFVILGMLVIGGLSTVSGAVVGAFPVTFAFEGLRALESAVNLAEVFPRPVVGLVEVALACGMIALLILRPGGIFARAEIGALLLAGRTRDRR